MKKMPRTTIPMNPLESIWPVEKLWVPVTNITTPTTLITRYGRRTPGVCFVARRLARNISSFVHRNDTVIGFSIRIECSLFQCFDWRLHKRRMLQYNHFRFQGECGE